MDVRDSEEFRKLGPNVVLCECQNARTQNSFVVLEINENGMRVSLPFAADISQPDKLLRSFLASSCERSDPIHLFNDSID